MSQGFLYGLTICLLALSVSGNLSPVIMWADGQEFMATQREVIDVVNPTAISDVVQALSKHQQNNYLAASGKQPDVIVVFGFEDLDTNEFLQLCHESDRKAVEVDSLFFNEMRKITDSEDGTSLIFPYVKSMTTTNFVGQLRAVANNQFFEHNLNPDGKDRIVRFLQQGHLVADDKTQVVYIGLGSLPRLLEGSFVDQEGFFELVQLVKDNFESPVFMLAGSSQGRAASPERSQELSQMDMRLLESTGDGESDSDETDSDSSEDTIESALNGRTVSGLMTFALFLIVLVISIYMLTTTQTPISYTKVPLLKGRES